MADVFLGQTSVSAIAGAVRDPERGSAGPALSPQGHSAPPVAPSCLGTARERGDEELLRGASNRNGSTTASPRVRTAGAEPALPGNGEGTAGAAEPHRCAAASTWTGGVSGTTWRRAAATARSWTRAATGSGPALCSSAGGRWAPSGFRQPRGARERTAGSPSPSFCLRGCLPRGRGAGGGGRGGGLGAQLSAAVGELCGPLR